MTIINIDWYEKQIYWDVFQPYRLSLLSVQKSFCLSKWKSKLLNYLPENTEFPLFLQILDENTVILLFFEAHKMILAALVGLPTWLSSLVANLPL